VQAEMLFSRSNPGMEAGAAKVDPIVAIRRD
jgi:hypothetical protein